MYQKRLSCREDDLTRPLAVVRVRDPNPTLKAIFAETVFKLGAREPLRLAMSATLKVGSMRLVMAWAFFGTTVWSFKLVETPLH